ncbi:Uncharacterized protein Fot_35263 [Forsythia ovata]|uniref:Uncharacterized protein n=1 Tax=Forsythia ovata TaxID=205694 RepID=A0ABD1SL18_9LAMI
MGPSKKGSTKGKGVQYVVSKARTHRILVATMTKESRAAAGPSRTEVPVNEDGFPSIWFQMDGVWTKPGVEFEDEEVEGAAHSLPSSPADWGAFMTDFWTFQANVMDNLSELRAQNWELMARQDHLDEMIKNLQDSEDDD